MALITCEKCLGRKKLDMMGGIYKNCVHCAGTGWQEDGANDFEKVAKEEAEKLKAVNGLNSVVLGEKDVIVIDDPLADELFHVEPKRQVVKKQKGRKKSK